MNKCPITYKVIKEGKYSLEGLRLLSKNLQELHDFPYTAQEQLFLAETMATKLSIQGIQPKLSVNLDTKANVFKIVKSFGHFIVKPPHQLFEELPQNEDLSMKLAKASGLEVPLHGMFYNTDQTLSYFIQRFDRASKKTKYSLEDFSQLLGYHRDTKYNASIEKAKSVIQKYCTFPSVEKLKFFRLMIFNYLIGNEDMHLKNFSLLTINQITKLSPVYDLINTTIVMKTTEELALPLNGKKNKLKKTDFFDYLGKNQLDLKNPDIEEIIHSFKDIVPTWINLINNSFLSPEQKIKYQELVEQRRDKLLF